MPRIGYHCSHEQHPPSALLEHVRAAERAGFAAAMCSDHHDRCRACEAARTHRRVSRDGHAAVGNSDTKADLETPEQVAARCETMSVDKLRTAVRISASRQQHVDWIAGDFEAGADQVFAHHVGPSSDL